MSGSTDLDTSETNEWLDSLRAVLHHQGPARAALRMFNVLKSIDLSYWLHHPLGTSHEGHGNGAPG